mgnify:CR=1 FL=1
MKAEDLFGQLSYTGKPFDCGYYVATMEETVFFADGEEKKRKEENKKQALATTRASVSESQQANFYNADK